MNYHPIKDQTGTFTCKAAKLISNYLKPLRLNEYSISDTQQFPNILANLPPLLNDEEDVFDGVESLFTNIPIKDTIEYIIKQIYTHKIKNHLYIYIYMLCLLHYNRRRRFTHDVLFQRLNNYQQKFKRTSEVSPTKFLDTSLYLNNGIYDFNVHRKTKQPTRWSSKIPKRCKCSMI